jgi:hypothetical protein
VVGPLGAWFTSVTNPDDFKGWAVGFGFHHEWSDELAKLPEMLADAQVARWQSKYGRDPTDQQRSWLVSKIRTDIAMMGIKLNAAAAPTEVTIKHWQQAPPLRACTRSRFRPGPRQRKGGWSWSIGTGPACKALRGPHTGGPKGRLVGWRMSLTVTMVEPRDGQRPSRGLNFNRSIDLDINGYNQPEFGKS